MSPRRIPGWPDRGVGGGLTRCFDARPIGLLAVGVLGQLLRCGLPAGVPALRDLLCDLLATEPEGEAERQGQRTEEAMTKSVFTTVSAIPSWSMAATTANPMIA